jgi:hypothetical protein
MDAQDNAASGVGQQRLTTRILNKLRPEHFRLPSDDSRKVKYLCKARRTLLIELRGYCNPDGTRVEPAVSTLAASLGWGRTTVFERLDELKNLGLLVDEARLGPKKPRRRHLNLARAQELLGLISLGDRPKGLPECIPTQMWQEVLPILQGEPMVQRNEEEAIQFLLAGLRHCFHEWASPYAEIYCVEIIQHALAIGRLSEEWWEYDTYCCEVEGCPANPETRRVRGIRGQWVQTAGAPGRVELPLQPPADIAAAEP